MRVCRVQWPISDNLRIEHCWRNLIPAAIHCTNNVYS